MEFIQIQEEVKKVISDERYRHSLGVVEKALEIAKNYPVDIEKIKKVAMAHDIAKEMTKEELFQYAQQYSIFLDDIEKQEYQIVHSKIGADISKRKFGFTKQMANAIEYHTTGNIKMDVFSKIIYIADKTEKGRVHIDKEKVDNLLQEDIDQALLYVIEDSIAYTIKKQGLLHPDTIYLRNKILKEKMV